MRCLQDVARAVGEAEGVEVEVEVEAAAAAAAGGQEAAVGDRLGEAPPCPAQSQVEEEGPRVAIGVGGVEGTGEVLGMSLM